MHRNVCCNNCRQKDISFPRKLNERPEDGTFGALFIGCAVYTLPVQPLANVIRQYTLAPTDRKKDISNSKKVAFFLTERVNSTISISHLLRYISANLYKQNTPKNQIFGVFVIFLTFIITLLGCISRICCSDFFLIGVNIKNAEILFPFQDSLYGCVNLSFGNFTVLNSLKNCGILGIDR